MIEEKHIQEELYNIYINEPLDPGDSISHVTLNECINREWAQKNYNGTVSLKRHGIIQLEESEYIEKLPDNEISICPICGRQIIVGDPFLWGQGECANCKNGWMWDEQCTEDYSDCWPVLVFDKYK